ncbi:MAG: hypothetical protein JNL38_33495 [Myxococcales bacterium]|nr:hypothetical protein [Myxococcales bacterium]
MTFSGRLGRWVSAAVLSCTAACGAAQAVGVARLERRALSVTNESKEKVCEIELVNDAVKVGSDRVTVAMDVPAGASKAREIDWPVDQGRVVVVKACGSRRVLAQATVPYGKQAATIVVR